MSKTINELLDEVINVATDLKNSTHPDEMKTLLFLGYLADRRKLFKELKDKA